MFARTPALERAVLALQHVPVGDPAAREHVAVLCASLASLTSDRAEALPVLRVLDGLGLDEAQVDDALSRMRAAADRSSRRRAAAALRVALEPARNAVLRHLEREPNGLRLLIDLRAALLAALEAHPEFAGLDEELRAFLAERFDAGALELRRLTWSDSAALLERLAQAEAVHAVRGWFDLKDRLDDDRRVYALFHPALRDVPLVFIEVALTEEFPANVRSILNLEAPRTEPRNARNAVFYSISNCEPGLGGIPFGNALIKRVVARLRSEMPKLRVYATLSPLPGFRAWLREVDETLPDELRTLLATAGWHRSPALAEQLREPLTRLAARYAIDAKRGDGAPRDAVTRFHVGNGATVDRICFLADRSERGLRQSFGTMVSYRYAPERIGDNQVAYALDHRVDASGPVAALAAEAPGREAPVRRSRTRAVAAAIRRLASRVVPARNQVQGAALKPPLT